MPSRLILICNASKANIYSLQREKQTKTLIPVSEFTHPESRKKGRELITDRPGHYQTGHSARGAYEESTDPKEHEADQFAKQIAEHLKNYHNEKKFHQLTVITPSHFFGLLENHLSPSIASIIDKVIQKDYTLYPIPKIINILDKSNLIF